MLIAIMTMLFLGGSSSGFLAYLGDTGDTINVTVADKQRRAEAKDLVDQAKKRTETYEKQIEELMEDLQQGLREHGASEDEINRIWEDYFTQSRDHAEAMIDLSVALRAQLNRDEWTAVFPPPPEL